MQFFNKYKKETLVFLLISVLYFALRLPNLTLQPIFADEAIYIRWAQVMRAEPTLRFLPLSDGKTPLFMWSMMPLFKIFEDPLYAGRFLSVLSGYGTLLGVLFLGFMFNKRVGLWSAFLVAITPFMVFFDRMALTDSMLALFSIWSLNLAILLMKYKRIDLAMFLGYALGGGLLAKTPAFFNILALPTTLILFNWREKFRQSGLLKIFGLWTITIFIAMAMYSILKLGPGFYNLNSRNQDYIRPPANLLERPWDPILPHTRGLISFANSYLGIPIALVLLFSIFLIFKKKDKYATVIFIWTFIPLFFQMLLLQVFTGRYILFSIPPLLVITAYGLEHLIKLAKRPIFKAVLFTLLVAWPAYFNLMLLTDIQKTPLISDERRGYLEEWTAGYGFPEIASYLIEESKKGTVVVSTEGFFGTLPDGLFIYLDTYSHIAPKGKEVLVFGSRATASAEIRTAAKDHQAYFVTNKSRYPFYESDLKLIKEFPKIKGESNQDAILFFQVPPKD